MLAVCLRLRLLDLAASFSDQARLFRRNLQGSHGDYGSDRPFLTAQWTLFSGGRARTVLRRYLHSGSSRGGLVLSFVLINSPPPTRVCSSGRVSKLGP